MDLKTLLDRTNDAINTIIRRDESTETGELLPPCIEGTLVIVFPFVFNLWLKEFSFQVTRPYFCKFHFVSWNNFVGFSSLLNMG